MDDPRTEQIPIPRSHFCSDDLPAADRFDAWSDSISPLFRPHLAQDMKPQQCSISTDAFLLGDTVLGSSSVAGVGGYRNPGSSPLKDAAEVFIIQYFWRGGFTGYNGAQALKVNAGDIVIMDPTRALSLVAVINSNMLTCVAPRRVFMAALGSRLDPYPRVISGRSLAGQILGHAMHSTWMGLPHQSFADTGAVSGMLLGAIAGVIRGGEGHRDDPVVDQATLDAICAYIERNLSNPELGPDHLCKRFHCSRAKLYRLFAPLEGIANYIRRARLERCHAALLTSSRKVNVSDVALEWGFGSISHFNRLFRETYGVTPGDVRSRAMEPEGGCSSRRRTTRLWVPEYSEWLTHI